MFNHYVAVDWAMSNMAIARMTEKSNKITVIDVPSEIKELIVYLKSLKGKICLTFEETTTSQWLYTELEQYVEKIIVCDPRRNRLLSEGPKTDKIDASKLVQLLKAELLKEVFHSKNKFVELRKIVSSYDDLIKHGVRVKNQRSALFRAYNKNHKEENELESFADKFVLQGLDQQIKNYEEERSRYQLEFKQLKQKNHIIKNLSEIPGIGDIASVKIVSRIVEAHRFPARNNFLSYCGLIKLERMSGGKSYGKKNPKFCRSMKSVFKTAALATIRGNNQFNKYYNNLLEDQKYSEHNARHAVARKIATVVYGIMKSGSRYNEFKFRREYVVSRIDS